MFPANLPHHLQTIIIRKAQVQDNDMKFAIAQHTQSVPCCAHGCDIITIPGKGLLIESPNLRLVIDNKNARRITQVRSPFRQVISQSYPASPPAG